MPLYDFVCKACGRTSEILVRSSSESVACPGCGKRKLERCMSAPAVIVKGAAPVAASAPAASKKSCSRSSCAGCGSRCH
ncbi:MAG: zinc ribbon domain-containing protein [Planctomycetes bacterium]|nr:zinc ribbon domain-containing protein [Planctomycetota bacterium]